MTVIKNTASSSCFLNVETELTQISAGPNSITTTREAGNFIQGPVSFSSPIENMKVGGIFRFNSMLSTGIPSTMVTPMPVLKIDLPMKNIAQMIGVAAIAASIA